MIKNVSSSLTSIAYVHSKNNTLSTEKVFSVPFVETLEKITGMSASDKSSQLLAITRKYDVENISPKEMAKMSQELFDNGFISFKVHSFLSFQPELNPSFNSTVGKLANTTGNPDQVRNFLKEWEDQLRELEKKGCFKYHY